MSKKITWKMIYKQFRITYPNLRKDIYHWCPYDYLAIRIHFCDGRTGIFDYLQNKLEYIENWR